MRSLVIWSPKGGTGKTTKVFQLLNNINNAVAFDFDPQGDLTNNFTVTTPAIMDIISPVIKSQPRVVDKVPISRVLNNKGIVCGDLKTALIEHELSFRVNTNIMTSYLVNIFPHIIYGINQMGVELWQPFDTVIIDTNPSVSYLNAILVMTADDWFIPLDSKNPTHTLMLIEHIVENIWLKFHSENIARNNEYYQYKPTMPTIVGGHVLCNWSNYDKDVIQVCWFDFLKKMLSYGITAMNADLTFIEK